MAKYGKKYRAAFERIDRERMYGPKAGFTLLKEVNGANYDPTVELAFNLGIDPRQADQMVRGAVSLPHGIGKTVRVAAIVNAGKVAEAEGAGADIVGGAEVLEDVDALIEQVDSIIATPDMMGQLGRHGKVLGPRGLMPNPKAGTVTMDVGKAVSEIKAGRVEYRSDRNGNVHTVIGKASFEVGQLVDNFTAMVEELMRQRPAAAKGRYMQNVVVSTSASPGIKLNPGKALEDDE